MKMNSKKILVASLSTFLIAGSLSVSASNAKAEGNEEVGTNLPQTQDIVYDTNKNLTDEKVDQRVEEINSKYDLNEPFSKEDAEFVVNYISPASDIYTPEPQPDTPSGVSTLGKNFYKGTSSKSFKKSKKSNGVGVTFSGKVTSHLNAINPGDQWYSGKTTASVTSGKAKVTKITSVVSQSAYGFIGNGGTYVGLIHDSSLTSTSGKKQTKNYLDQKKKYSAILMAYAHTTTYVKVYTTTGSFNLYGF